MTEAELRANCEAHAPSGCAKSRAVLRLFAGLDAARGVAESLARRVAAQSELLSRCASKAGIDPRTYECGCAVRPSDRVYFFCPEHHRPIAPFPPKESV